MDRPSISAGDDDRTIAMPRGRRASPRSEMSTVSPGPSLKEFSIYFEHATDRPVVELSRGHERMGTPGMLRSQDRASNAYRAVCPIRAMASAPTGPFARSGAPPSMSGPRSEEVGAGNLSLVNLRRRLQASAGVPQSPVSKGRWPAPSAGTKLAWTKGSGRRAHVSHLRGSRVSWADGGQRDGQH
jgi:hypothetical protein